MMTNTISPARAISAPPPIPAATAATGKEASVDLGNIVVVKDITEFMVVSDLDVATAEVVMVSVLDVATAEKIFTPVFTLLNAGVKSQLLLAIDA